METFGKMQAAASYRFLASMPLAGKPLRGSTMKTPLPAFSFATKTMVPALIVDHVQATWSFLQTGLCISTEGGGVIDIFRGEKVFPQVAKACN